MDLRNSQFVPVFSAKAYFKSMPFEMCLINISRLCLCFFLIQVAVPEGQEIINRVFIGGLARDVSWTRSLRLAMFLGNRLSHGQ